MLICPFLVVPGQGRVSFAASAFSCSPGEGVAGRDEWQGRAGAARSAGQGAGLRAGTVRVKGPSLARGPQQPQL